ncbi:MAG TPA: hypothetical protein VNO50_02730 [Pyrinomonadaceae bacterium]|nr:hypothetical protein [Pyrinomonadaceae bacterium]
MAEERTLGLVRAREVEDDDPSKAALQRRMEETRDSISNTVTEIRDTVNEKYENVKEALDWREHFKRQPVAWTLGAAGVGFFVGYGLAAALTDNDERADSVSVSDSYARPLLSQQAAATTESAKTNGHDEGPGLLERFKETSAYDRLSREAGSLGDRLVEELSTTAHTVVLPLLLNKLKTWIGVDLSEKQELKSSAAASMGTGQARSTV